MRCALDNDNSVDKRLPYFAGLVSFDDAACNLILVAHTTPRATRDFGNFRQNLLFRMRKIITARGGAITYPTQARSLPCKLWICLHLHAYTRHSCFEDRLDVVCDSSGTAQMRVLLLVLHALCTYILWSDIGATALMIWMPR